MIFIDFFIIFLWYSKDSTHFNTYLQTLVTYFIFYLYLSYLFIEHLCFWSFVQ